MSNTDNRTDWRILREFAAVDLTRSFVLSWELDGETLLIDVDVLLTEDHPFYEKPRPAEKVCIRPAVIEFPFCEALASDRISSAGDPRAVIADLELGAIAGFARLSDGRYELDGEFGVVHIDAERPILRMKGP
jgi:hypothetical protein